MANYCFHCLKDVSSEVERGRVGRTQSCPACSRDLHVCKNCRNFDTSAYNQCKEPNAERVVDKEKSNFCDYFSFAEKNSAGSKQEKKDYLKDLDNLFKK